MKKFLFLGLILLLLAFVGRGVLLKETQVLISPESELLIKGNTNVSNFKCNFNFNKISNPIPIFFEEYDDKITFDKTVLVLDNFCFDCGGKAINKDFQELLKSEAYPKIFLELKAIKENPKNKIIHAFIDLKIAGVTKSFTLPVTWKDESKLVVNGSLDLRLSDFSINPPKKFLGLVVIEDSIEIGFQLVIQEH